MTTHEDSVRKLGGWRLGMGSVVDVGKTHLSYLMEDQIPNTAKFRGRSILID